jgi:hypothetical protein
MVVCEDLMKSECTNPVRQVALEIKFDTVAHAVFVFTHKTDFHSYQLSAFHNFELSTDFLEKL